MTPSIDAMHPPNPLASLPNKPIKLNVGGTLFQINTSTLQSAGNGSLLAQIAQDLFKDKQSETFLDRDPDLFGVLLFVLRSKRLPSNFGAVDMDQLIDEAKYYGMLELLQDAMSPPRMDGLDIEKIGALLVNGRDFPSALAAAPNGSLCLGHGSKITFYDWALRRHRTILTEFSNIESLHMISEKHVAVGAYDMLGLHVYDLAESKHKKTCLWTDLHDPRVYNPTVHAITSTPTTIFVSFSSAKAGDNTIACVHKETLEIVDDMGRQRGISTMVPTKLEWMEKRGLLVAGSMAGGAFGHTGLLRLFDVRSKEQVWEWKEPNMKLGTREKDSFADWATAEEIDGIFKIGVRSGQLELLELRMMKDEEDPWLALEETRPSLAQGEGGATNLLAVSGRQVFCSRGGDLEVWNEVPLQLPADKEYWETAFRRNYVDQRRNMGTGHTIKAMTIGGNRLFLSRTELQGVEVWETRRLHGR